jgi:hypothetical protein
MEPINLRKQLRTNQGASDQDKSGSQESRNPERKAEPIVIPGFQIPFLVFRFDFIHHYRPAGWMQDLAVRSHPGNRP